MPESEDGDGAVQSVTATAAPVPVPVTRHPGDGSTMTCRGRGRITRRRGVTGLRARLHSLQHGAAGRRVPGDGHVHLGCHLAGGRAVRAALPPLFTTATAAFRVAESKALNTSGGA